MREIFDRAELLRMAAGDTVVRWAGQEGPGPAYGVGVRAWRTADAVAVTAPVLSRHDRLAVRGPVDQLAELVPGVLREVGPSFRLFGDEDVVRGLAERVPELVFQAAFGWMDTTTVPPAPTADVRWLDDESAVADLLAVASPDSYAEVGGHGVRRWVGVTDQDGKPLSVAAEAWSAPDVGFVAGVATRPDARGRGLSREVCAFLTRDLLRRHGTVALMVDGGNEPAIAVYRRLGYAYRAVGASRVSESG